MESMIYAALLVLAALGGLLGTWLHGHKTGMQDADQARKQEHHEHQD